MSNKALVTSHGYPRERRTDITRSAIPARRADGPAAFFAGRWRNGVLPACRTGFESCRRLRRDGRHSEARHWRRRHFQDLLVLIMIFVLMRRGDLGLAGRLKGRYGPYGYMSIHRGKKVRGRTSRYHPMRVLALHHPSEAESQCRSTRPSPFARR